ncbi:MAG: hypothetical protein IT460_06375 [Planctomycetes bacterium]|nr:hypothetical protein [Planctomycetota bacterium]
MRVWRWVALSCIPVMGVAAWFAFGARGSSPIAMLVAILASIQLWILLPVELAVRRSRGFARLGVAAIAVAGDPARGGVGDVVDVLSRVGGKVGGASTVVAYRYPLPDGSWHDARLRVPTVVARRRFQPGSRLTVLFDPRKPKRHALHPLLGYVRVLS